MAQGEAEHGCAQGEGCRPGHHEPLPAAKHHRRPAGPPYPAEPGPPRGEDDPPVPRQRTPESPVGGELGRSASCRNDQPGWAGAHRHGPVRPRHRAVRQERPPRRWC
ncbi:hypothetical protein ACFY2R_24870 [Micromonospora olivasterospora]|uniref:Uncharacterized protein n=1 Tax=Micromonospora olivasterospora TaxID=1880 RepID=A0A562I591_MICOL|nr:hypothetical protein [Micromonospora olivasterospora]TWH65875.1 hypothetical protein JD77_00815 [Micromonospora olivasterospora]